ncbi:MAG: RNase A-like domain-containing protein, partial [Acidobacteriota bacterium]
EVDESLGGHTLARHVGRTDAQLARRLRQEAQISAASTYTDRATAEAVVGSALAASSSRVNAWMKRAGPRPNLVLHYSGHTRQPIGRSLSRREGTPVACESALVVLRWDERRSRFYVLTSYPEVDR